MRTASFDVFTPPATVPELTLPFFSDEPPPDMGFEPQRMAAFTLAHATGALLLDGVEPESLRAAVTEGRLDLDFSLITSMDSLPAGQVRVSGRRDSEVSRWDAVFHSSIESIGGKLQIYGCTRGGFANVTFRPEGEGWVPYSAEWGLGQEDIGILADRPEGGVGYEAGLEEGRYIPDRLVSYAALQDQRDYGSKEANKAVVNYRLQALKIFQELREYGERLLGRPDILAAEVSYDIYGKPPTKPAGPQVLASV